MDNIQIDLKSILKLEMYHKNINIHEIKIDLDNFLYIRRTGIQQEDLTVRNVGRDLISDVTDYLVEHYPKELQESFGNPEKKAKLKKIIAEYIPRNTNRPTKGFTLDELTNELINSISGLDKFDTILSEPGGDITDIGFNGTDIWVQDNVKGIYKSDHRITADAVEAIAKKIAYTTGKTWNFAKPDLDTELPNLRINAMHPDISPYGTTMAIRVFSEELRINEESFVNSFGTPEILNLLKALVKSRTNILISGDTGTGKTELLKFLVGYIPDKHALNMLEDTLETNLKKLYPLKNIWNWKTRISETDKDINISFSRLTRSSVRVNPKWIIVSETRGGESYDMLKAGSTGHAIMTSVHSVSAEKAPDRIIMLCQEQVDYRTEVLGGLVTSTFNVGIHLELDEETMTRRISKLVEFTGYDNDQAITVPIFDYEVVDLKEEEKDDQTLYVPESKYIQKNKISEQLANRMLSRHVLNSSHLSLLPTNWAKEKGLLKEVLE